MKKFSDRNVNFLSKLFKSDKIISWVNLKNGYELTNHIFFLVGSVETYLLQDGEYYFLNTVMLVRAIYIKIVTLKELPFCFSTNYLARKYIWFLLQTLLINHLHTPISKNCLKTQLQIVVKFICHHIWQLLTLSCILCNIKFLITTFFSQWKTKLDKIWFFAHFVTFWRKFF